MKGLEIIIQAKRNKRHPRNKSNIFKKKKKTRNMNTNRFCLFESHMNNLKIKKNLLTFNIGLHV